MKECISKGVFCFPLLIDNVLLKSDGTFYYENVTHSFLAEMIVTQSKVDI